MDIAISYIILFFSAFLGGLSIFFFKSATKQKLKLILSFSGSYLFAICALHLLPEVYGSHNHYVGLFVLLGFAFQILLEQFSQGVEHGHIHIHKNTVYPWGLMFSLCLHAFLETLPLMQSEAKDQLLIGISIHHIPAAFALGSILIYDKTKKVVIVSLFIFALMSPLGLFTSSYLDNIQSLFKYIMAFVIGIFLHISTTILFESSEDHKFNKYKMFAIFIGAGIAIVMFLQQGSTHHHH